MTRFCARLSLALALLPALCLADTEVFSGWVDDGDTLRLGDYRLKATYISGKVLAAVGLVQTDIPLGECRRITPFDICFLDSRLLKGGTVVPDDIHDPDVDTQMLLEVSARLAKLEVSRNFGKNTFDISEEVSVSLTVENTGDAPARDVILEDEYPGAVQVAPKLGCDVSYNTVAWHGTIKEGEKLTCSYTLKGQSAKKFASAAAVEYNDGMQEQKAADKQTLEVLEPFLNIEIESKSTVRAGDTVQFTVSLKNTLDGAVRVNRIAYTLPGGLALASEEGFKSGSWEGTVQDNMTLSFSALAERTGSQTVEVAADYSAHVSQLATENRKITVKKDIAPDIRYAFEPERITVSIFNPETDRQVKNIRISLVSDILNDTREIAVLGRKNIQEAVFGLALAPGRHWATVSVAYENEQGEKFGEERSKEWAVAEPGSDAGYVNEAAPARGLPAATGAEADDERRKLAILVVAGAGLLAVILGIFKFHVSKW